MNDDPTDDPRQVRRYRLVCAGVHWMREKNRAEFRFLKAEIQRETGKADAWQAEVKEAFDNGFIVPPEYQPNPGVQAS